MLIRGDPIVARGTEAVKAVAEVADLLPASVDRVFRSLQAPKDDHAPIGKLGGGKSTPHMELHHLRNLGLGITAQPLTAAVQWVDRICSFSTTQAVKWSGEPRDSDVVSFTTIPADPKPDGTLAGVLISSNFGHCFERLIEQTTEPGGRRLLRYLTVNIVLDEKLPRVIVMTRDGDGFRYSAEYLPTEKEMISAGALNRIGAFTRSATIHAHMIYTLGDLWRDTLAHRAGVKEEQTADRHDLGQTHASAAPETQNAALPGAALQVGRSTAECPEKHTRERPVVLNSSASTARVCPAATPQMGRGNLVHHIGELDDDPYALAAH